MLHGLDNTTWSSISLHKNMASQLYAQSTPTVFTNVTLPPSVSEVPSELTQFIVGIICSLTYIVGLSTNFLIFLSVCLCSSVRNNPNTFIASLAVRDFLFLSWTVPVFYVDFVQGSYPFGERVCMTQLTMTYSIGLSSVLELTNIAISRYLRVCNERMYKKLYTKFNTALFTSLTWIIGFSMGIPTAFLTFQLDDILGICYIPKSRFKAISSSVVLGGTFVITSWCYFRIFRKVHQSRNNLFRHRDGFGGQPQATIGLKSSLRDFCVFAFYTLLLLPFVIVNSFGLSSPRYLLWDFAKLSSYMNSVSNGIIYGLLNKRLRICILRMLPKCRRCPFKKTNSVAPSGGSSRPELPPSS